MAVVQPVVPDTDDVRAAVVALERLRAYVADHPGSANVRLYGDGEAEASLVVPGSAMSLFEQVLVHLADGRQVSVVPADEELTTQQAADMLHVSRPYFVGLLEAGEIPYRKVGTRRRVRYDDLLAYQRLDDARRRQAASELTRLSAELGVDY